MAIVNTQGSFSTGRDIQVILVGAFGNVPLTNITEFTYKQETAKPKVDRLDGVQMHAALPKGWSGNITLERGDAGAENFFVQTESAWYSAGSYLVATLYVYISERGGSTTSYAWDNVALSLEDGGTWKGDSSVRQRLDWMANRMRGV